jgi:hypothetical protein
VYRFAWALLFVLSGCRLHTLQDGPYDLRPTEVLRDDCELSRQPEVFGASTLLTAGHNVRLGTAYLGAELSGTYRFGLEQMTLDATLANVRTRLRGQECQVDTVSVALDSVTQSPTRFSGTLSYTFQTRSADACTCRFFVRYEATRSGVP